MQYNAIKPINRTRYHYINTEIEAHFIKHCSAKSKVLGNIHTMNTFLRGKINNIPICYYVLRKIL